MANQTVKVNNAPKFLRVNIDLLIGVVVERGRFNSKKEVGVHSFFIEGPRRNLKWRLFYFFIPFARMLLLAVGEGAEAAALLLLLKFMFSFLRWVGTELKQKRLNASISLSSSSMSPLSRSMSLGAKTLAGRKEEIIFL